MVNIIGTFFVHGKHHSHTIPMNIGEQFGSDKYVSAIISGSYNEGMLQHLADKCITTVQLAAKSLNMAPAFIGSLGIGITISANDSVVNISTPTWAIMCSLQPNNSMKVGGSPLRLIYWNNMIYKTSLGKIVGLSS